MCSKLGKKNQNQKSGCFVPVRDLYVTLCIKWITGRFINAKSENRLIWWCWPVPASFRIWAWHAINEQIWWKQGKSGRPSFRNQLGPDLPGGMDVSRINYFVSFIASSLSLALVLNFFFYYSSRWVAILISKDRMMHACNHNYKISLIMGHLG